MAVPDRRVANSEIAPQIGVTEEWIGKRTGTSSRPWAREGERMSDFAARAGKAALERAGLEADQLDLVLVATLDVRRDHPGLGADRRRNAGRRQRRRA
jgi:3-oxoacyl-[acyl-carrier-protein] synthase III